MRSLDFKTLEDKRLVELIGMGNRSAFDVVYERYWERLFLYLVKVIRDEDEAQDILQDVFISIWNRRHTLNEVECLSAYLFTATRFKGLSYFKKLATQGRLIEKLPEYFTAEHFSPAEFHIAKELSITIDKEIESLPDKMKAVFILSRREELSYKEIGKTLQISDNTVKKQVHNALKIIRLKLIQAGHTFFALWYAFFS